MKWLYQAIIELLSHPLSRLKERWEDMLATQLSAKDWERALGSSKKVSRNAAFKYLQFNWLHRTYFTPHRLNVAFGGEEQACPRCSQVDGDWAHMTWACPRIIDYWTKVVELINKVLSLGLACLPAVCLLDIIPRPKAKRLRLRFADLALLLAKRRIALSWKSSQAPLVPKWEDDVSCWARAEEWVLIKEDKVTKRRKPLAEPWADIVKVWEARHMPLPPPDLDLTDPVA